MFEEKSGCFAGWRGYIYPAIGTMKTHVKRIEKMTRTVLCVCCLRWQASGNSNSLLVTTMRFALPIRKSETHNSLHLLSITDSDPQGCVKKAMCVRG